MIHVHTKAPLGPSKKIDPIICFKDAPKVRNSLSKRYAPLTECRSFCVFSGHLQGMDQIHQRRVGHVVKMGGVAQAGASTNHQLMLRPSDHERSVHVTTNSLPSGELTKSNGKIHHF